MLSGNKGFFRLYYKNPNPKDVFFGIIFFNKDNTLTLGLSINQQCVENINSKLKEDFRTDFMMISYEVSPPDNK